jgi:tRNA threonylcarbamoyl adenosine modification protein YeaZ
VGIGPGTFTGVRITVATARALALSLSVPVFGVSTLAALAARAAQRTASKDQEAGVLLVPVVDARRQQLFYALYEPEEGPAPSVGARWSRRGKPTVCGKGDLGDAVGAAGRSRILAVGESRALVGDLPAGCQFVTAEVQAEYLVLGQDLIGEPLLKADGRMSHMAGTPESVHPIYVRSPDADVHITKMRDPWADGGDRAHGKG